MKTGMEERLKDGRACWCNIPQRTFWNFIFNEFCTTQIDQFNEILLCFITEIHTTFFSPPFFFFFYFFLFFPMEEPEKEGGERTRQLGFFPDEDKEENEEQEIARTTWN
jgi:hypothetical protein